MDLIAILLLAAIIGVSLWLIVKSLSHSSEIDTLKEQLNRLQDELAALRHESMQEPAPPEKTQSPPASVQAPTPVEVKPPPLPSPAPPPFYSRPRPTLTAPTTTTLAAPASRRPAFNWEQFMGVKLFAWVGGLAAFLAVAFFVKYSFDHDLISPAVRVALGFLFGLGLLGVGLKLNRKNYYITSVTLCATGIVVLYAVTYAGHAIYEFRFFSQFPAFVLMAVITATAFFLALQFNGLVIAVLGMLGGFLTPFLLSTGSYNPAGLFGYIALLNLGLIALALKKRRWNFLVLLAAVGTAVYQAIWVHTFFDPARLLTIHTILLGFALFFVGAFLLVARLDHDDPWWASASLVMSFAPLVFACSLLLNREVSQPGKLLLLIFVADACLLALPAARARWALVHLVAGVSVFLLLALWVAIAPAMSLVMWILGAALVFAVLHSFVPVVLERKRPGTMPSWSGCLFAPVALVLMMMAILRDAEWSLSIWPFVLAANVLAMIVAVCIASIHLILVVLVLSLLLLGSWMAQVSPDLGNVPEALLVIAVFAALFFVAGGLVSRFIMKRNPEAAGLSEIPVPLAAQAPALSAVSPFLLLVMVAVRFPIADPTQLFVAGLALVFLLLGLARWLALDWFAAVGLVCVVALQAAWHAEHLHVVNAGVALIWHLIFFAVFLVFPFVFKRALIGRTLPWSVAALSGPLHFLMVYGAVDLFYPNDFMGLVPAALALPMLAGLYVLARAPGRSGEDNAEGDFARPPGAEREEKGAGALGEVRRSQLAWFGGAALFFITLIFPIQFEREWLTISWALLGVALCWLFRRVPHPGLRATGAVLLAIVFVRLALNPAVFEYHPRSAAPVFNWFLYTYGIAIACCFIAARLLAPPRNRIFSFNAPPFLYAMGTVLAFLLMNIEIADYFGEGQFVVFEFSGHFARDMTYTIAWALFALVLVVIGLWKKVRPHRYAGIGLLSVTLLKLFLHDLASLDNLYRVGALMAVAAVAMLASFLYQRHLASERNASG